MKAQQSFKTSVPVYQSTEHNIPKDLNLQHYYVNLKSHNNISLLRVRDDRISKMVLNVKLKGKRPRKGPRQKQQVRRDVIQKGRQRKGP
jgi:hypothetical protein